MGELEDWLKTLGLEEYAARFAENRIDVDVLSDLTDADLEKLDIPLGDRKRLLKAVAHLTGQVATGPLYATSHVERRQMTVMFVDLVGSTALSERLDLDEFRAVIKAFNETVKAVLRQHNGFLAQIQGDGVLAYFGYPRAEEDDPERAVAAGLAVAQAVEGIDVEPTISLEARVGMATGLVDVGDLIGEGITDQWTATGESTNLASRIEALAEPGTVLVDDVTRKLIGNEFQCDDFGTNRVKGFSEPVQVWRVRKRQFSPSRFESYRHSHLTPFINREEEIQLLRQRWQSTKASSGQAVLISGEPGIGKSRLAKAICDQVASEHHTNLHYQCVPNAKDSPFHPISSRLERIIGFTGEDSPTEKFAKLERWALEELNGNSLTVLVLAKLFSIPPTEQNDAIDLDPKEFKESIYEILLNHLSYLLAHAPLILLFEDIQWADPTTQEFLEILNEWLQSRQIFLICTCRPEYIKQGWVGEGFTHLNLRSLDRQQSAAVVESVVGGLELPSAVEARILAKTDGVPLFLEELTKTVLESGSLRLEGHEYKLHPDIDAPGSLPTTLRGSLLARLDRLPRVQDVAPLGAAIGRTFDYALLKQIVEMDDEELQSILSLIIDARLLTQRGAAPEATFKFKHELVRDAAYETMPKSRRREIHGRIATALRECFPETCSSKPEIVADHFTRSNEPAEARQYWREAAIMAGQKFSNAEAVAHLKKALAANEFTGDPEAKVSHEIQLREMLYVPLEVVDWGSEEIADNLQKLRTLQESRGDSEELLSVLNGICGDHLMGGRIKEARAIADEMLLVEHEDSKLLAAALANRFIGICELLSGQFASAISHLEKTIDLTGQVNQHEIRKYYYADSVLMARVYIAWSLVLSGRGQKAQEAIQDATHLIEKEVDAHSKMYALCILASIHQSAGDPEKSFRVSSQALALAREQGRNYWEAWAQIMLGWAMAIRGSQIRGIEELEEGILKYERIGSRQMLPYAHLLLADAYFSAGETERGSEIIQDLDSDSEFEEIKYIEALKETLFNRDLVNGQA